MKDLKVIPADPAAKAPFRQESWKQFKFNVIDPDTDRFHGRRFDVPDFDGSPRLLPVDWIGSDGRAA